MGFAAACGGLLAAAAGGILLVRALWRGDPRSRGRRAATAVAGVALLAGSGLFLWTGANDPHVGWFGPVTVHGPRDRREVALTFDDGPDPRWTDEVADILARHHAKATFFLVGKAVDAWPEVAERLYDGGHLLGNHSYHHDYWRWLDPRYPELERTQHAIEQRVGVCPALFRPPHGQRTPFLLTHVRAAGLRAVTWDVSAEDWSDTDGARVARRILDQVRPGSIVLLHDGLDGAGNADRSVLLEALPLILDGLAARNLTPVRLDALLDVPAYLDIHDC